MAFSGVLPRTVYDVGPGGPLVTGAQGVNALIKSGLENQYYGPNMQSQIEQRNALTQGQNIENQFSPERLAQANKMAAQQNQFYAPNIQSEIASRQAQTNRLNQMTPQEVQQMQLGNQKQATLNKFLPQSEEARIAEEKAKSSYYQMGGGRTSADQKNYSALQNQIMMDNPGMDPVAANQAASALIAGEPMPSNVKVSGLTNDQVTKITGKNAPAALKNQAANIDILLSDLKGFDIDAFKNFAGPSGKAALMFAKARMATNPDDPNIDPVARRYFSGLNDVVANMDSMRKAYGTSVVPDYVYKTLGKLSNPNDDIWNDPKQVQMNWDSVMKRVQKNRDMLMEKVKHGVTASSPEEQKGNTVKWKRVNGQLVKAE